MDAPAKSGFYAKILNLKSKGLCKDRFDRSRLPSDWNKALRKGRLSREKSTAPDSLQLLDSA